jgi:hypothetical protein
MVRFSKIFTVRSFADRRAPRRGTGWAAHEKSNAVQLESFVDDRTGSRHRSAEPIDNSGSIGREFVRAAASASALSMAKFLRAL